MQAEDNGVALVTGAAGGIGAAISSLLAARGWHVAGLDLDRADTELAIQADVTDRAAVRAAAERTADELGEITLLVSAAGVYEMAPVAQIDVGTPTSPATSW